MGLIGYLKALTRQHNMKPCGLTVPESISQPHRNTGMSSKVMPLMWDGLLASGSKLLAMLAPVENRQGRELVRAA